MYFYYKKSKNAHYMLNFAPFDKLTSGKLYKFFKEFLNIQIIVQIHEILDF